MTPQPPQELWMIGWSSVERASILKRRRQARAAIDQREYGKAPLPPPPPSWDGLEPFDDGFEEEVAKLAPKADSPETENAELLTPHPVTDRDAIAQALIREMGKPEAGEDTPSLPTDGLTPDEKAAVEAGDVLQAKPSRRRSTRGSTPRSVPPGAIPVSLKCPTPLTSRSAGGCSVSKSPCRGRSNARKLRP